MKTSPATDLRRKGAGLCLIAAPAVMLCGDALRIGAGRLYASLIFLKLSFAFFVPAILALVHLLSRRADRWALAGGGLGLVGCLAGAGIITASMILWSMEAGSLGEPAMRAAEEAALRGGVRNLLFLYPLPGLAFPIGLLVLSLGLLRVKAAPAAAAILVAVGAILFPVGRIGNIYGAVLGSGLTLLAGMGIIGWRILGWSAEEWKQARSNGERAVALEREALAG